MTRPSCPPPGCWPWPPGKAPRVLGLGATTGTLELGKAADLIVVDVNRPTSLPSTTPTRIWSMRPGPRTSPTSWWAAAGSSMTGSLPPWIGPPSPAPPGTTAVDLAAFCRQLRQPGLNGPLAIQENI